jgi:hypothetical protein
VKRRLTGADAPLYTTGGKPGNWPLLLQILAGPSRNRHKTGRQPT